MLTVVVVWTGSLSLFVDCFLISFRHKMFFVVGFIYRYLRFFQLRNDTELYVSKLENSKTCLSLSVSQVMRVSVLHAIS